MHTAARQFDDVIYPEPSARARSRAVRALEWVGFRAQDVHGTRLGRVVGLVVDRQTGDPQWLLLEERHDRWRCVPLDGVVAGAGRLTVPYPRSVLRAAPLAPADGALSPRQERELCLAYGVPQTRGARLSLWERRRSTALAIPDLGTDARYRWEPPARKERETVAEAPRSTGREIPDAMLQRRRSALLAS